MGLDIFFKRLNKDNEVMECIQLRKTNFVMHYMESILFAHEEEIENCEEYALSVSDINQFISRIKRVIMDNSLAEDLLPTQSGFFWGNTEYDEYYFDSLVYTLDRLTELMSGHDETDHIIFIAWW